MIDYCIATRICHPLGGMEWILDIDSRGCLQRYSSEEITEEYRMVAQLHGTHNTAVLQVVPMEVTTTVSLPGGSDEDTEDQHIQEGSGDDNQPTITEGDDHTIQQTDCQPD